MATARKDEKKKTWLSGFCNPTNPADSHMRCKGEYNGTPCSCAHHQTTGLPVETVAERYLTPPGKPLKTYSIAVLVDEEPETELVITVQAGNPSAALSLAAAQVVSS